jgi:hypothetical protein
MHQPPLHPTPLTPRAPHLSRVRPVVTDSDPWHMGRGATGDTLVLVSPLARALETALRMFGASPSFTLHVIPELAEFNSKQGMHWHCDRSWGVRSASNKGSPVGVCVCVCVGGGGGGVY